MGLVGGITILLIYMGLFYAILIALKTNEKKLLRSFVLAIALRAFENIAPLITGFVFSGIEISLIIATIINTILILIGFYYLTRKILNLKAWLYIGMPIGVSIVGHMIYAFLLTFYFNNFAAST